MNNLVFQGGTALRLCYGSNRFSEYLDFVGGFDFTAKRLSRLHQCIMDRIGSRYGLEINVKTPKEMHGEPCYQGLKVDRWQVSVTTNPDRRDIPRQKIKLEVVNIPAHTSVLRGLNRNYDFLPASYQDILIPTETLSEILADKVVFLSCCQDYIRHRDVWDLMWLKRQSAEFDPELVNHKIEDYRVVAFDVALASMRDRVIEIATSKDFHDQMVRFIIPEVRATSIDKPGFPQFLGESVAKILTDAHDTMFGSRKEEEFSM